MQGKQSSIWMALKNMSRKLKGSYAVESFSEIINNGLEPVHLWYPIPGVTSNFQTDIKYIKHGLENNQFTKDKMKKLEQRLKICRNQCYQCHLCERTFGLPDIDSMMRIQQIF
jgi:hypothetical protein